MTFEPMEQLCARLKFRIKKLKINVLTFCERNRNEILHSIDISFLFFCVSLRLTSDLMEQPYAQLKFKIEKLENFLRYYRKISSSLFRIVHRL